MEEHVTGVLEQAFQAGIERRQNENADVGAIAEGWAARRRRRPVGKRRNLGVYGSQRLALRMCRARLGRLANGAASVTAIARCRAV